MGEAVNKAKCAYFQSQIEANAGNMRQLFGITSKLLGKKQSPALPAGKTDTELSNDFAHFFSSKILAIREQIEQFPSPVAGLDSCDFELSCWTPVTQCEMQRVLKNSGNKSCSLDPLPTDLLKECLDPLLSPITLIIN